MKIDLNSDLNPGIWYDMEGTDVSVCLRVCTSDSYKEIRKKTVRNRVEYKQGQRFMFEDTNEDERNKLVWDYCIVDWKGIYDAENKPIPCTKEFKLILMNKSVKFAEFVTTKLNLLRELKDAHSKEEEKN